MPVRTAPCQGARASPILVVTARLWLKGVQKNGAAFERRLWFSDTYVRTPQGWKYAFAQASMDLPKPAPG